MTLYVSTGRPKSTVPGRARPDARPTRSRRSYDQELGANAARGLLATSRAAPSRRRTRSPGAIVLERLDACGSTSRRASAPSRCRASSASRTRTRPSALQGAGFTVVARRRRLRRAEGHGHRAGARARAPRGAGLEGDGDRLEGPGDSRTSRTSPRATLADARALLEEAGFKSVVVPEDVTDPSQDGLVLSQDPAGGRPRRGRP